MVTGGKEDGSKRTYARTGVLHRGNLPSRRRWSRVSAAPGAPRQPWPGAEARGAPCTPPHPPKSPPTQPRRRRKASPAAARCALFPPAPTNAHRGEKSERKALPDPLGHQRVQIFPGGQLAQEFPVGFVEDPIGVPGAGGKSPRVSGDTPGLPRRLRGAASPRAPRDPPSPPAALQEVRLRPHFFWPPGPRQVVVRLGLGLFFYFFFLISGGLVVIFFLSSSRLGQTRLEIVACHPASCGHLFSGG